MVAACAELVQPDPSSAPDDEPGTCRLPISRGSPILATMRFDPQLGVTNLVNDSNGRRRHGRLEQESLVCDLGPILDLSATGMRIIARRLPKREFEAEIYGIGVRLHIRGEVRWSKRIGLMRFELGIRFIEPSCELTKQLTELALAHRRR
jgi:hypothetical protein